MPTSNDTSHRVRRLTGGAGNEILISVLVGVGQETLGLDPFDILQSIERLVSTIWNMDTTRSAGCGAISCSAR